MSSRLEAGANGSAFTNGSSAELNDPKYKKYALAVEKCLTTFDNVHEWADFISFLTKLLKTFQAFMQFKEIPRKLLVAKRLSQCLNPALPNGVHQRALDVYSHVLAVIGPDGLRRDLALWSSGLFPFFEYAATSVKPTLLNLYDTHYIPLKQGLRPILKAFILALLPGAEEEAGEFFEKVLSILDKLSRSVSPEFFFQNMWLVLMTTPAARSPAINYLSRRMPQPKSGEDLLARLGGDVGLVVRAFAMALEDEHLLVKRGILDLMNQSVRMDGPVMSHANSEDKAYIMNAAIGVVLRRDVSLNRRVNTWLLGSLDESSEARVAFYKKNSLQLLSSTLKSELDLDVDDAGKTRPYKIFISLLDTWEIGSALTEVFVLDLLNVSGKPDDEVVVAAGTVFERAEPRLLWKKILVSTIAAISAGEVSLQIQNILQLAFVLFKNHDDEAATVHIPLLLTNILLSLVEILRTKPSTSSQPWVLEVLRLLPAMFKITPSTALFEWQRVANELELSPFPPLRAKQIYELSDDLLPIPVPLGDATPLAVTWDSLVRMSMQCVTEASSSKDGQPTLRVLTAVVATMNALLTRLKGRPMTLDWDQESWRSSMLASLSLEPPFELVDELVTLVVSLTTATTLSTPFDLGDRSVRRKIVHAIFRFFDSRYVAYHARATQLFWALHSCSSQHEIEGLVSEFMFRSNPNSVDSGAVEAFGVLWRFSEDIQLPGFQLKVPLLAVLDALRSENPGSRRVGETWMRGSLKSYLRVLDPILYALVSTSITRVPFSVTYQGRSIRGYHYVRPFDQKATHYYLESLLAVVRFGGQGLVRVARGNAFNRTPHPTLYSVAEQANVAHSTSTYLDVVVDLLMWYIQSDASPDLAPSMSATNLSIQSTVLELIQAIVTRGELDNVALETIESALISRLYDAVHTGKLDLQNKLLHVLHSVIFAASSSQTRRAGRSGQAESSTSGHLTASNPLFVQMLIDGLSRPSNRPVLQHWIDFVMMTVAQFPSLAHSVSPLCDCICRQLRVCFSEYDTMVTNKERPQAPLQWNTSDADILLFLNALERLVLLSLSKPEETAPTDDVDKPTAESSTGLLGYVFGGETQTPVGEDTSSTRPTSYKNLQEAVRAVHSLWSILGVAEDLEEPPYRSALASVVVRVRARCMKTLEHLFKVQSSEVLESLIECWLLTTSPQSNFDSKATAIEVIDDLTASAQIVVQMLCSSISSRVLVSTRSRRTTFNPNLSDLEIFTFLEFYFQRLEGPIAVQVWPTFANLSKELLSSQEYKLQMFPLLRCTTAACDKISQTPAFDDRKFRRELQDTSVKLLDNCILIAGRSFDQGHWLRNRTREKDAVSSGRNSPEPSDNERPDEKNAMAASNADLSRTGAGDLIDQINRYLSSTCLPVTKRILVENDKVANVCTNIVYYIISPAMKARSSKTGLPEDTILDLLAELVKIAAASKVWKPIVSDAFGDSRFFNASPAASLKWRPLIKGLIDTDKQSVNDLLAKMAAAPSATIFTSRETEMLLRSLNLRRLSYAVYTGDRNQFLAQLPVIQERLVDILRPGAVAPIVHSEVYLCMRILLCRLSPHNLSSFWPVMLTELLRVFQQVLSSPPADKSDELQLVLSTCKFLDLLLTLQTEEFQVHQWIFITDTVDAVYRADNSAPESLMDLLTDSTSALPDENSSARAIHIHDSAWKDKSMRKPMLLNVRSISSIKDLIPFFSHVSLYAYETTYMGGLVDWDAVEQGLLEDLFDGR
ncbi:hypothetical protein DL93DRAFT_1101270 [Clavulina sp. PMI_390]|nr:hypothetical protein DL93DRAFT_1101270 [Clavulina sp. PMI_390]